MLNPLSALLEAFRASLLGTAWPSLPWLGYSGIAAAVLFVAGAYSFKKMERKFADVI
jgi:lipopolysaccharide transport system permease protein